MWAAYHYTIAWTSMSEAWSWPMRVKWEDILGSQWLLLTLTGDSLSPAKQSFKSLSALLWDSEFLSKSWPIRGSSLGPRCLLTLLKHMRSHTQLQARTILRRTGWWNELWTLQRQFSDRKIRHWLYFTTGTHPLNLLERVLPNFSWAVSSGCSKKIWNQDVLTTSKLNLMMLKRNGRTSIASLHLFSHALCLPSAKMEEVLLSTSC